MRSAGPSFHSDSTGSGSDFSGAHRGQHGGRLGQGQLVHQDGRPACRGGGRRRRRPTADGLGPLRPSPGRSARAAPRGPLANCLHRGVRGAATTRTPRKATLAPPWWHWRAAGPSRAARPTPRRSGPAWSYPLRPAR